jgi:signal transduction histidine kinase
VALAQGADETSEAPDFTVGTRDVPEPLIETVALEGEREPDALAIPVPQPFQSVLAIPVVGSDEDYGSLAIYRQGRQRFTPEETNLAALFGDQAALAVENARLREQAREAAVLAERNRIARDLHDAVTQEIFSASIIADSLPRVWERSQAEGQRGLAELRRLTHGALAEMRTLLIELRPTAILEKKLGDLMAQLGGALNSRTRLAFDIAVHEEGSLPPDVHVALYRIIQEAINNIAKHANARHVWVQGQVRPERAVLKVYDDGCGFETGALPGGQLGIGIMQERARSISARLRVHSRPGRGTLIAITWDETGGRQPDV